MMRADRLLSMVMLLQARGKLTTQTLARELGVSRRTVLRDMDALSIAGIPIYASGGHGGGVALDEHYRVTLTGLNAAEVRALFVSSNARLLQDVGLGEAAESTLLKLFAALPAPHQPLVDQIRQRILIDPLWWWHELQPLPFWEDLQRAVYSDHCIHATYEHYGGEMVERVLEPFSLVAKASLWYLIARREGELRTYRVSRFHAIMVLDETFERPADFDLPTYWHDHIQDFIANASEFTFTLRLRASRLSFAQGFTPGRWEVLEPEGEDGWLSARFQMENIGLAKMLVFGLGDQAYVIEPDELRQAVWDTARSILKMPIPKRPT